MHFRSVLCLAVFLLGAGPAAATTFTVTNSNDTGTNSLRWAIDQANAAGGNDTVAFNIPGAGAHTINLASALSAISTTMVIDGTTQPGYAGAPLVELNGASAGAGSSGLVLSGAGSTVKGLAINRFAAHGVYVSGSGNTITACHVGLSAGGTSALPNGHSGVWLVGANNIVGPGNVLSGNAVDGVRIDQAAASGNVVKGNRIGTNAAGTAALPNGFNGIVLSAGSSGTVIGGTTPADLNVISGNSKNGIGISTGATALIERNYIGLAADGAAALGNMLDGVLVIDTPGVVIGGNVGGSFNIIASNGSHGIELRGDATDNTLIQRSIVGSDLFGTLPRGNAGYGIQVDAGDNTQIGGGAWGAGGNLVSANVSGDVHLFNGANDSKILGNRIGSDFAGTTALGSGGNGVFVENSARATIGTNAAPNLISGHAAGYGIDFSAATASSIVANYIGTTAGGDAALANATGIGFGNGSDNNVIGGSAAARNVIAGNSGAGLQIYFSQTNRISSNYIGLGASGGALGNGGDGIYIDATGNTIGGSVAGAGNVISANGGNGIASVGPDTVIAGNYIGTDAGGTLDRGNVADGIDVIWSEGVVIGGGGAAERNVISGNGGNGIELSYASESAPRRVLGNYIGTTANGLTALGNGGDGIFVSDRGLNVIGEPNAGNVIAGNIGSGVHIESIDARANTIQANRIGIGSDGSTVLGNAQHGVAVVNSAGSNLVGGTAAGEGNTIRGNGGDGIYVAASSGNEIDGNAIAGNGGLGIDLGGNGVTANDAGDADAGANDLQNFPQLTSAISDGANVAVSGTLNSVANGSYRVEFFVSPNCDASGNGEGATPVGALAASANGSGNAAISVSLAAATAPIGQYLTATATRTDAGYGTSEFSACRRIAPAAPVAGNGGVVCNRQTLGLTASAIAGASYAWSGPNGFSSTVQNPTIANAATAASGSYNVVATVNGSPSAAGTTTATVNACTLSINNPAAVAEGNSGTVPLTFTVSLSSASAQAVTVDWATANGTAVAPGDYAAGTGTLTIPANATSATIARNVVGDTLDEGNETFSLNLSNASAGSIADAQGIGTINDDDAAPTVSIGDKTCTEGNSGSAACVFTITLSAASGLTVSGNYATASGGATPATAGSDYTAVAATAWSIAPGQPGTTVNVSISGDTLDEANETFLVNLSALSNAAASGNDTQATGTIADDDAANGQLRMSECVADISELVANIQLTVERVNGSNGAIGVSYATANGTALAGSDYTATSGTLSWPSGDATVRTITVPLINNTAREDREDFRVNLSTPTGGASLLAPSASHVWILDGQDQVYVDGFDLVPPCN